MNFQYLQPVIHGSKSFYFRRRFFHIPLLYSPLYSPLLFEKSILCNLAQPRFNFTIASELSDVQICLIKCFGRQLFG